MNDKELLELAAKAAGIRGVWWDENGYGYPDGSNYWNPLTDDGSALRLAVKADIKIVQDYEKLRTEAHYGKYVYGEQCFLTEPHKDDPYASTRRAIVRASAEIGKGMTSGEITERDPSQESYYDSQQYFDDQQSEPS